MYKKVCCTCKVVFLLIKFIVVVYRFRFLHLVFSITQFYIFFKETIRELRSLALAKFIH